MRFKTAFFLVMLMLQLRANAQDSDYPTLDALANLDVPGFDFVDMVGRMSRIDPKHIPPESPPSYEIGERQSFRVSSEDDGYDIPTGFELRGQTEGVLIWIKSNLDYPIWRAQALAQSIERNVLTPMLKLFQFTEPPGVDGDPRLYIAMIDSPKGNAQGYFAPDYARPLRLDPFSNQREMIVVSVADDDEYDFFDKILVDTIAHEYLHVLQFHTDPGEVDWLNEGLASFAGFRASKQFLSWSDGHSFADIFLETPDVGLTQWQSVEDKLPKYGASLLFVMYLTERFGDEIVARLLTDPAKGWFSIVKVLKEYTDASADEIFADWALANYFLDARRGYGYPKFDADLTPPQPVVGLNSFPATYEGELPQYSTDYIAVDVRGADKLLLRLWQEPEARLINLAPEEGEYFYYAVAADYGHNRLTRAFDLNTFRRVMLEFRLWYDLDAKDEYAYITVSDDGGSSWETLRGRQTTTSAIYGEYYPYGYTGRVANWRFESIDLSSYAPGEILVRFELVSDYGTSYHGVAIDDLHIDAINYHDDFESPDDSWIAEGWIRTDNRLPNNTWLQVTQDTGNSLHVSRELVSGNGELSIDLLPGVGQALVAVSPVVPLTSLPTEYELEAILLDAAGEVMVVSRECSVTTTYALNFRDAPNGNKIGLLPEGTAVDVLGREGDWFQVDYNGAAGWAHADYVIQAGTCP